MVITSKGPLPSGGGPSTRPARVSGRQVVHCVGAAGALPVRADLADALQHLDRVALLPQAREEAANRVLRPAGRLDDLRDRPVDTAVLAEATARIMAAITAILEEIRGELAPAERYDLRKHRDDEARTADGEGS